MFQFKLNNSEKVKGVTSWKLLIELDLTRCEEKGATLKYLSILKMDGLERGEECSNV